MNTTSRRSNVYGPPVPRERDLRPPLRRSFLAYVEGQWRRCEITWIRKGGSLRWMLNAIEDPFVDSVVCLGSVPDLSLSLEEETNMIRVEATLALRSVLALRHAR